MRVHTVVSATRTVLLSVPTKAAISGSATIEVRMESHHTLSITWLSPDTIRLLHTLKVSLVTLQSNALSVVVPIFLSLDL